MDDGDGDNINFFKILLYNIMLFEYNNNGYEDKGGRSYLLCGRAATI